MAQRKTISTLIPNWLDKWHPNETVILSIIAVFVGLASGAGVWLFKGLINLVQMAAFGKLGNALLPYGKWTVALIPILGGLVVGWIIYLLVGHERHHGVAGIMEAVALTGGRLRYKRIAFKAVASALGIGSGASVGPEDPSVQIGANVGSMFGQWLHLSDDRMRALVAAGSAGGIAAAFNAPIAGVFFALEIILGEISGSAFGIVVVAAVVSAIFTQAVAGPSPAFKVPSYAFNSAQELPLYLVLGILSGPVAALYIRGVYAAQDFFTRLVLPSWIKPAIAGLIVGITGIFLPQIFGVGYSTIEKILANNYLDFWLLLVLLAAKLLMTSISIAGGFMGGVFAPSLYLGATLGAAYGILVMHLFPTLPIAVPAFAMVGMASVLAGAVHSPLTAIILLFEMTNDYRIILPLMFAVIISLVISEQLHHESIYTLALARKGIRLERGRDVEVMQAITVGEVMQTDFMTIQESTSLDEAAEILMKTRHHGLPVVNRADELVGVLTVTDIDRAHNAGELERTVGEICSKSLEVAYPDETIGEALRRMSARDIGRLPVVDPNNVRHMVGLLRRNDVVRAYDIALTRRAALRHRAHQVRLGAISDERVSVNEVTIEPGAPCIGKKVSEIEWPRNCVIATLRRGRQFLIPHGDTVLKPGDTLVVIAEGEVRETVINICQAGRQSVSSQVANNNSPETQPQKE